ncbi:MAG: Hsp70 family protein [Planctomycetaceae bacterium]
MENFASISWLNEHGQPVTILNQKEHSQRPQQCTLMETGRLLAARGYSIRVFLSRPRRAARNAIHGNAQKFWTIDNKRYSAIRISGLILRKLISDAQEQIGEIREAVITVPASSAMRNDTQRCWRDMQQGWKVLR